MQQLGPKYTGMNWQHKTLDQWIVWLSGVFCQNWVCEEPLLISVRDLSIYMEKVFI